MGVEPDLVYNRHIQRVVLHGTYPVQAFAHFHLVDRRRDPLNRGSDEPGGWVSIH